MQALRLDVDYLGDHYPPLREETLPLNKPTNGQNSTEAGHSEVDDINEYISMSVKNIPRVKFTSSVTKKY